MNKIIVSLIYIYFLLPRVGVLKYFFNFINYCFLLPWFTRTWSGYSATHTHVIIGCQKGGLDKWDEPINNYFYEPKRKFSYLKSH